MRDFRYSPAEPAPVRLRPSHDFGLHDAAAAPVRRCVVNHDWDARRFAVIGLIRGHPRGPSAVSTVHVDLGCLGIRHAALRLGSPEALAELLAESGLPPGLWNDCPPGLVAALIDAGADLGWINGAEQCHRFRLVQRLFDPIDPDDDLSPIGTGHPADGQPLYVPQPEDDGPAIVAHLGRVFGPTGFAVAGEPPLPTGDQCPFGPYPPSVDGAVLRAGVLGRRLMAWKTAARGVPAALAAAIEQARSAGLGDAVAHAAAPWHARVGGRAVVSIFAESAPSLTPLDRAFAGRWADDAGLRLLRLDAVEDGAIGAWDPLSGQPRRLVTDDRRLQRAAERMSAGAMIWAVTRPLDGARWFVDRLVPVEGGAGAAERALIAFESAVVSVRGPEPAEDSLDVALERAFDAMSLPPRPMEPSTAPSEDASGR